MGVAALGPLPPVAGALTEEAIDRRDRQRSARVARLTISNCPAPPADCHACHCRLRFLATS
jgi:hypothetical protein